MDQTFRGLLETKSVQLLRFFDSLNLLDSIFFGVHYTEASQAGNFCCLQLHLILAIDLEESKTSK